jgi:hypothetical protein
VAAEGELEGVIWNLRIPIPQGRWNVESNGLAQILFLDHRGPSLMRRQDCFMEQWRTI